VISRRRCDPRYIQLIPATVDANINAASVFGNKYMAFSSPKNPVFQHISSNDMIDVSSVTTEFNTLFEDGVSISDKVDPVKLGLKGPNPGNDLPIEDCGDSAASISPPSPLNPRRASTSGLS
jgi:hypothetical protein